MKFLRFASKFPKWVIAGGIIVGSSAIFLIWWNLRHTHGAAQSASTAAAHEPRKLPAFNPSEVILCGNTLVNTTNGEIIAREWLAGFGDRVPNIVKILTDERLVLVLGDKGVIVPFDFDGNARGPLAADGKAIRAAAYAQGGGDVAFVRDGNLWRGRVDWKSSTVENPQRLTDTGSFREEVFQAPWVWHGDTLLLKNLGRLFRVSLVDGRVEPDKSNLGEVMQGISPDGSYVLMPQGQREMGVYDFANESVTTIPTGQHVNRVLWLNADKAVVQVGQNQLGLYEVATKKLTEILRSENPLKIVSDPSPDGECFIVATTKSAGFYDLKRSQLTLFDLPFEQAEWNTSDSIIASSQVPDSEQRGTWLIRRDGKPERLLNQPPDKWGTSNRAAPTVVSGYFISSGDLWLYEESPPHVRQLTHGKKLTPALTSISGKAGPE